MREFVSYSTLIMITVILGLTMVSCYMDYRSTKRFHDAVEKCIASMEEGKGK